MPLSSDELRSAVSFPFRLSSVKMLPGVITGSHLSFSSVSSSVAFRSPVSPLVSSSPCPITIRFRLSIIFLRSSTSPSNLTTSVHSLHLNTVLRFISVKGMVPPPPEVSKCIQQLQSQQTRCLLATGFLVTAFLLGAIVSINRVVRV